MKKCAFAAAMEKTGLDDRYQLPSRQVAESLAQAGQLVGKTSINDHRRGECSCSTKAAPMEKFSASGTDDRAEAYTISNETAWGYEDFCEFIRSKGQDPDQVTFSWSVTSNPAGGYWNKLTNVKPKAPSLAQMVDYEALAARVRELDISPADPSTAPLTYVVGLADWQLGKGEGDGTVGTVERIKQSLANVVEHILQLRQLGILPRTLLLANLGDHTENVYSSYANQAYVTDLNVRDQINLAIELNLLWLKTLAPYFPEVIYAACLCNHGQLTRQGGKTNMTDDSDNATGLIGDMLTQLCSLSDGLKHVQFIIPRDEMITVVETNGVNMALSHGHKISGAEETWLAKQSQNLAHRRKFLVDIWFTAHKHHLNVMDLGPYTRIQATTNDPGSKYFEDMSGQYSRSGTTVFLTGADVPGHFDHLRVL